MTHFNLQSRQSYETVPTEPCGSPISFPILDLQPPVYSDNGELLIPSGEENVVGNDAASQPTDTNESPTNRPTILCPTLKEVLPGVLRPRQQTCLMIELLRMALQPRTTHPGHYPLLISERPTTFSHNLWQRKNRSPSY